MADAAAAIVADHGKRLEPELLHHLDLIERHRALRIVRVIVAVRRLAAVAVAAQVGDDHGVILRQLGRHQPPGDHRLRRAVQQQHRRALTRHHAVDRRAADLQRQRLEAREEPRGRARPLGSLGNCCLRPGPRQGARGDRRGGPQHIAPGDDLIGRARRGHRSLLDTVTIPRSPIRSPGNAPGFTVEGTSESAQPPLKLRDTASTAGLPGQGSSPPHLGSPLKRGLSASHRVACWAGISLRTARVGGSSASVGVRIAGFLNRASHASSRYQSPP